jgi:hypothetical protein
MVQPGCTVDISPNATPRPHDGHALRDAFGQGAACRSSNTWLGSTLLNTKYFHEVTMFRATFFLITGYRNFTKDGYLKASKGFDERYGASFLPVVF